MKNSKLKYYLGEVKEHNGEYEYNHRYLFKTTGNPKEYATKIARDWYGEDSNRVKEDDGFWHNGEILTRAGKYKKIPQAHYKIMKQHLLVL